MELSSTSLLLVDRVEFEVCRLKDVTNLMQRYSTKPRLKVEVQLESLDLIECRERVRATQSIWPILEWWELFKVGRASRNVFILKEFLKLIFLVYKDYLLHLYAIDHQLSQQFLQELDAAVATADSIEEFIRVLDNCYHQIKILFNISQLHYEQQHAWHVYLMPAAILVVLLFEKVLQSLGSSKPDHTPSQTR